MTDLNVELMKFLANPNGIYVKFKIRDENTSK